MLDADAAAKSSAKHSNFVVGMYWSENGTNDAELLVSQSNRKKYRLNRIQGVLL